MKKSLFTLPVVLSLMACGTIADGQSQLVTVKTPGAENAKCILENQDLRVSAYTDQTVRVMKSPRDLVVRCQAPGNREQTILVKREINDWSIWNVANGFVPGVTYDYFSRGLFDYPVVLTVSFSGTVPKPYPAPKYASEDMLDGTHKGGIPYYGPTRVQTESDRFDVPVKLEKRNHNFNDFSPAAGGDIQSGSSTYQGALPSVSYDPTEEDK